MIPISIKTGLEQDEQIKAYLDAGGYNGDWSGFTRVVFNGIARRINKKVTRKVIETPILINDQLLIGEDELRGLFFRKKFSSTEDFISHLKNLSPHNPHRWISGKSLQSYWNGGRAKDKKLNVLLTYLDVSFAEWEEWKLAKQPVGSAAPPADAPSPAYQNSLELIRKYYLGDYFLYYQKTDGSPTIVKAPFRIRVHHSGTPFVETVTEGQHYRSNKVELRDGVLYLECENLEFNEKESHVFYLGNDTNPEVILGISSTISVKRKLPIGIRNVLVRQAQGFGKEVPAEKEIPLDATNGINDEEKAVAAYLRRQPFNLMVADFPCSLAELHERM